LGLLHIISQNFTWIALGDVDLHFPVMWVRKPMLLKRKLH